MTDTMDAYIVLLIVLGIQLLAITVEVVLYLVKAQGYFAAGPVVARQRWQSRGSSSEAVAAVEAALVAAKLSYRRDGGTFAVRRPWWEFSTYPRITLTVESGAAEGAAIVVAIKPLVTGVLFLFPAAAVIVPRDARASWTSIGLALFVVATYAYFFAWERKRLHALNVVREGLAGIGVGACARCGYDLFGLPAGSPCPECGDAVSG